MAPAGFEPATYAVNVDRQAFAALQQAATTNNGVATSVWGCSRNGHSPLAARPRVSVWRLARPYLGRGLFVRDEHGATTLWKDLIQCVYVPPRSVRCGEDFHLACLAALNPMESCRHSLPCSNQLSCAAAAPIRCGHFPFSIRCARARSQPRWASWRCRSDERSIVVRSRRPPASARASRRPVPISRGVPGRQFVTIHFKINVLKISSDFRRPRLPS